MFHRNTKTTKHVLISICLAILTTIGMTFGGASDNAAAAGKIFMVSGTSATYDVYSGWIGLEWFKTKGAKKYEVQVKSPALKSWKYFKTVKKTAKNKRKFTKKSKYKVKSSGKKYKVYKYSATWKKCITTKKTEADYYVKKSATYSFRVRGINGKKKGAFSGVLKVPMKLKKLIINDTKMDTERDSISNSDSSNPGATPGSTSRNNPGGGSGSGATPGGGSDSGTTPGGGSNPGGTETGFAKLHTSYAHTVIIEASKGYKAVVTRGPKTVTRTFEKRETVTIDMTMELAYNTTVKIYDPKQKIVIDKLIPAFMESDDNNAASAVSAIKSAYNISDSSDSYDIALATAKWMCDNIQYTNYTSTPAVQIVLGNHQSDSEAYANVYAYLLSVRFGIETKFATDTDSHKYVQVNITKNGTGNPDANWINVDVFKMDGGTDDAQGDQTDENWFGF